MSNDQLASSYERHYEADGDARWDADHPVQASSDIGTVSLRVATIQPLFRLSDTAELEGVTFHTVAMKQLARSPATQRHVLRAMKAMALTACDVFKNENGMLEAVRSQFPPIVNGTVV